MTQPTTIIFVATAGAIGVAGATAFLVDSSHQADNQACRQDAPAAQGQPTAATATRPDDPQNRKPEDCDHQRHHSYHASGGGTFFTPTSNRSSDDDDDAPRAGRAAGSGGEAESAGHAGFGASAAGHGGGGE
ncbi:hypothetical protein HLH36_05695 [Gluconacetobacter aggeris]|uniref:Uncharacterized protein n=1 Tax=Gluconacetobacter aggeris TaxID=1286186 RepID=A0A7W4IRX1_9PROT|nr:hypothetical protein [Gluconacetobacter aggeris]MBB2167853.1 hypothetical protein [Gluconacetobacter aggeris]